MKVLKYSLAVILFFHITVFSQDRPYIATGYVKTPAGTNVEIGIINLPALTADQIRNWRIYVNTYFYDYATIVADATRNYNCHDYAWNKSSGGADYWMNDPQTYMLDGSYEYVGKYCFYCESCNPGTCNTDVTWTAGDKIFFGDVDLQNQHSAVAYVSSPPGWIISKWGEGPLVHGPSYATPYSKPPNVPYVYCYRLKSQPNPSTTINKTYPAGTTVENYPGAIVLGGLVPSNATVAISAKTSTIIRSLTVQRGAKIHFWVIP